jgi:hypothetical protein
MLTLLSKSVPTKFIKFFSFKIFFICHRCQRHRWSTLSCEYLREFSKKFETVLMGYSGAGGKLIHKKTRSKKSRDTVPLSDQAVYCTQAQIKSTDRAEPSYSHRRHAHTAKKIRFMCSQILNCAALFPNFHIHLSVSDLNIFLRSVHLFCCRNEEYLFRILGCSVFFAVQTTDAAYIVPCSPVYRQATIKSKKRCQQSRETLPLSSSCFIGGRFVKRLLHARERDPELTRLLTGTADDTKIKVSTREMVCTIG